MQAGKHPAGEQPAKKGEKMYLNRESITAINALKTAWGAERFAQTNSRLNGNYLEHVRLYQTAGDKKAKTHYVELSTLRGIREKLTNLNLTGKEAME